MIRNDQFLAPEQDIIGFTFDAGKGTQYGWLQVNMEGVPHNAFSVLDYAYAGVPAKISMLARHHQFPNRVPWDSLPPGRLACCCGDADVAAAIPKRKTIAEFVWAVKKGRGSTPSAAFFFQWPTLGLEMLWREHDPVGGAKLARTKPAAPTNVTASAGTPDTMVCRRSLAGRTQLRRSV